MREPGLKEQIYFTNLELEAMGRKVGRIVEQLCSMKTHNQEEIPGRPVFHVERADGTPDPSESIREALAGAAALMEQATSQLSIAIERL